MDLFQFIEIQTRSAEALERIASSLELILADRATPEVKKRAPKKAAPTVLTAPPEEEEEIQVEVTYTAPVVEQPVVEQPVVEQPSMMASDMMSKSAEELFGLLHQTVAPVFMQAKDAFNAIFVEYGLALPISDPSNSRLPGAQYRAMTPEQRASLQLKIQHLAESLS